MLLNYYDIKIKTIENFKSCEKKDNKWLMITNELVSSEFCYLFTFLVK